MKCWMTSSCWKLNAEMKVWHFKNGWEPFAIDTETQSVWYRKEIEWNEEIQDDKGDIGLQPVAFGLQPPLRDQGTT